MELLMQCAAGTANGPPRRARPASRAGHARCAWRPSFRSAFTAALLAPRLAVPTSRMLDDAPRHGRHRRAGGRRRRWSRRRTTAAEAAGRTGRRGQEGASDRDAARRPPPRRRRKSSRPPSRRRPWPAPRRRRRRKIRARSWSPPRPRAPASPAAARGVPGGRGAGRRRQREPAPALADRYLDELLRTRISDHFRYPEEASELELTGRVVVQVTIDRNGRLLAARLAGAARTSCCAKTGCGPSAPPRRFRRCPPIWAIRCASRSRSSTT